MLKDNTADPEAAKARCRPRGDRRGIGVSNLGILYGPLRIRVEYFNVAQNVVLVKKAPPIFRAFGI